MNNVSNPTRTKILDSALSVIRTKGYTSTTVDELCFTAGVTKGAFFHHFESKEQLAIEAADHFAAMADGLFERAAYHSLVDPVDRLLGYVDFRIQILCGEIPEYTCLFGTMVQEIYLSHPAIRERCELHMTEHIDLLVVDIGRAIEQRNLSPDFTATSLGYYIQSVIQGAFIYAKATCEAKVAVDCLTHLRRYLELIFNQPQTASASE